MPRARARGAAAGRRVSVCVCAQAAAKLSQLGAVGDSLHAALCVAYLAAVPAPSREAARAELAGVVAEHGLYTTGATLTELLSAPLERCARARAGVCSAAVTSCGRRSYDWEAAGLACDVASLEAALIARATTRTVVLVDPLGSGLAWLRALFREPTTPLELAAPDLGVRSVGAPLAAARTLPPRLEAHFCAGACVRLAGPRTVGGHGRWRGCERGGGA